MHQGSANSPVFGVGFIWNSLDSLVRNELFQWVTATLGPFLFLRGVPLPHLRRKGRPASTRRSTALKRRRAERAGYAGNPGSRHRQGPIGHWDQTTTAFPFLQGIVVSVRFHTKVSLTDAPLSDRLGRPVTPITVKAFDLRDNAASPLTDCVRAGSGHETNLRRRDMAHDIQHLERKIRALGEVIAKTAQQ